jgi:threonine dehydrogenase-like Zn-dependent dehydrogenase
VPAPPNVDPLHHQARAPVPPDVLDGVIEPGRVFDRTVSLDDVPAGYRAMDQREALKVLVRP